MSTPGQLSVCLGMWGGWRMKLLYWVSVAMGGDGGDGLLGCGCVVL